MQSKLHTFSILVSLVLEESKCGRFLLLFINRSARQRFRSRRHRRIFRGSQTHRRGRRSFFVRHIAFKTYLAAKISFSCSKVLILQKDTKNSGTENMRNWKSSYFHCSIAGDVGEGFIVEARIFNPPPTHGAEGTGNHHQWNEPIRTHACLLAFPETFRIFADISKMIHYSATKNSCDLEHKGWTVTLV